MKYRIEMIKNIDGQDRRIDMPSDHNLSFREAIMRMGLYSRRNPNATFEIIEEDA